MCGLLLPDPELSPMDKSIDPDAPLRTVTLGDRTFAIHQRVTGALVVRWPNGAEQLFPVGFSVDQVEQELRNQFASEDSNV